MKLILLLVVVYLVYRAFKSWVIGTLSGSGPEHPGGDRLDDVMVKDPVCGIHFPRREGVAVRHEGQELLFCSAACRDRFLEEQK